MSTASATRPCNILLSGHLVLGPSAVVHAKFELVLPGWRLEMFRLNKKLSKKLMKLLHLWASISLRQGSLLIMAEMFSSLSHERNDPIQEMGSGPMHYQDPAECNIRAPHGVHIPLVIPIEYLGPTSFPSGQDLPLATLWSRVQSSYMTLNLLQIPLMT
jgi:hypothetical protein